MCFTKKINKKVNKQDSRNSENWLFDDVSEIIDTNLQCDMKNQENLLK